MRSHYLASLTVVIAFNTVRGQTPPRTYVNPIDIDYRYNFEQHNEGISYRSGADLSSTLGS